MTDRTLVLTDQAQQRLHEASDELSTLAQWYGDHPVVLSAYRSFAVSLSSLIGMGGHMAKAFDYDGFVNSTDVGGMVVGMVKHRAAYPDGLDDWAKENAPEPFEWSLNS